MDFKEFEEKVIAYLNEYYEENASVTVKDVVKNNAVMLRGITVCFKGVNISPTVYLNDLYRDYENGKSIGDICSKLAQMIDDAQVKNDVDVSFIRDYGCMKDRVLCKLVNRARNEAYLNTVPHIDFLDLAVVFYTIISDGSFGSGTITVTNDQFKEWGVSVEEVYKDAKINTIKILGGNVSYIEDVIISLLRERRHMSIDEIEEFMNECEGASKLPMYVLTNGPKTLGAACILDNDRLNDFSNEMESDLFILPCSIHETILLPVSSGYDPEILGSMVREINDSEVEKTDYLSDSVYRFRRDTGLLEIA
ncbi:MAG: hypothetical protein IKR39_00290 [Lachnospiraceae bacterium]|nr:hypothetical protein [Lachnospiraceae bacterium]